MLQALGLIETKGLVGAIEAADAMCKAANVKLVSKEKVTGALIVVKIVGEVAAVKSAVDAGAVAAQRVGQLVSAHVIPRPDDQIEPVIYDNIKDENPKVPPKVEEVKEPENEPELEFEDEVVVEEESEEQQEVEEETHIEEDDIEVITDEVQGDEELEEELEKVEEVKEEEIEEVGDIPPKWALEKLNVHELRKLARSFDSFPIKGRDISKANRQKLIDYFDSIR